MKLPLIGKNTTERNMKSALCVVRMFTDLVIWSSLNGGGP